MTGSWSLFVVFGHYARRNVSFWPRGAESWWWCWRPDVSLCAWLEGFIFSVRLWRWGLLGSLGLVWDLIQPANKWNRFFIHYGPASIFTLVSPVTHTYTKPRALLEKCAFLSKWHIYTLSLESHIRNGIGYSERFREALKWNAITAYSILEKHSSIHSLSRSVCCYEVRYKCDIAVG